MGTRRGIAHIRFIVRVLLGAGLGGASTIGDVAGVLALYILGASAGYFSKSNANTILKVCAQIRHDHLRPTNHIVHFVLRFKH